MKPTSRLLIKEPPLQVLPSLACAIGLNHAIALQQLHYLIENDNVKGFIDEDGEKWIYNTYDEWKQANFRFWSESTIKRVFTDLEGWNLVFSRQFAAADRDMRKYYRPNYPAIDLLEGVNLTSSNGSHWTDVKGNTENQAETDGFKQIAAAIMNLQGGAANGETADLIKTWLSKHELRYIFNAISIANGKRARSAKYVDSVLIGWEANGYPLPREERVKAASRKSNSALDAFKEKHGV